MTSQQQQIQQQIQFTIQTLLGESFQVSISVTEAEKVYRPANHSDPYNNYGLDYLKEAISIHTGNDPVSQQLICQEELTNSTPLITLASSVITLIVKPSFTIKFITPPYLIQRLLIRPHYLARIECYLFVSLSKLRVSVRGIVDDYFKIAIADLILANAILLVHESPHQNSYIITTDTPTYVWLRFYKSHIKIVEITQ
jgi:hypothetical protein